VSSPARGQVLATVQPCAFQKEADVYKRRYCMVLCMIVLAGFAGSTTILAITRSQNDDHETFKLRATGMAIAADGTELSVRSYQGSSGTSMIIKYGSFETDDKAKAHLGRHKTDSTKIFVDEPKKDSSGKVIGQRVILAAKDANGAEYKMLIWTQGRDCYQLESSSMPAILWFEGRMVSGKSLEDKDKP
jgi:hypothetical protein